jgi:hypothetical protein
MEDTMALADLIAPTILSVLCCASSPALPVGKTPFGELVHTRSVAADIVVHLDAEEAERIYVYLRQHPDARCAGERCLIEASLIDLPNGRRLGTRVACLRDQSHHSCVIDLERTSPRQQHRDRSRLLDLRIRLTGKTAESLYPRLVMHPEAFNAAGEPSRERTLNIAVLQRGEENQPTESRVFCSERVEMVCVLTMEYRGGSFPSDGPGILD